MTYSVGRRLCFFTQKTIDKFTHIQYNDIKEIKEDKEMKPRSRNIANCLYRGVAFLCLTALLFVVFLPHGVAATNDMPSDFATFIGDQRDAPRDAVTLTFYYGSFFYRNLEYERAEHTDIPVFDLYIESDDGTQYHIRRVEENYVSEKYRCYEVSKEKHGIVYRHGERVLLPSELFVEESGRFRFCVRGTNVKNIYPESDLIIGRYVFYQCHGDTVRLSTHPFEE